MYYSELVYVNTVVYHSNESMSEGHPFKLRLTLPESIVLDIETYPIMTNYSIDTMPDAVTVEGKM